MTRRNWLFIFFNVARNHSTYWWIHFHTSVEYYCSAVEFGNKERKLCHLSKVIKDWALSENRFHELNIIVFKQNNCSFQSLLLLLFKCILHDVEILVPQRKLVFTKTIISLSVLSYCLKCYKLWIIIAMLSISLKARERMKNKFTIKMCFFTS